MIFALKQSVIIVAILYDNTVLIATQIVGKTISTTFPYTVFSLLWRCELLVVSRLWEAFQVKTKRAHIMEINKPRQISSNEVYQWKSCIEKIKVVEYYPREQLAVLTRFPLKSQLSFFPTLLIHSKDRYGTHFYLQRQDKI